MLILAIIILILFFWTASKRPLLSLSALAAILPAYNLRFTIFGLPSTILEFAVWGAFFGWALSLLWKRRAGVDLLQLIPRLQKIKYPLILFFLASIISIFAAPNLYKAFGLWRAFFLEPALVLLMLLSTIKDKRDFSKIIFGLSISALAVSLVAMGQRFFGLPILPPWDKELRATSVFIQPNMVGLYLGPIIILLVGQIIETSKKSLTTYYLLLTTTLSLIAIALAKSDGAIVGVLAGFAIFFILQNAVRPHNILYSIKILLILLIPIFLFFIFYFLFPDLFLAIKNKLLLRDWSGFVRLNIWKETWEMLKDNWLLGAGVGGYPIKILPYHASRDWMEVYPMPHNIIFNFWSELGILGLAAFLWLLEKFYKMCYTLIKSSLSWKNDAEHSPLWKREVRGDLFAISAIAAMSALLVHGLVDVSILKNDLAILFWIIYAIPFICHSRLSDSENIRESS